MRYVFVTLAYTWFTHMCWLVVEILVVVVVMVALLLLQDVALDFFKLLNYVFLLLFGLFDLYLRRQTHTYKLWVGVFFVCFHVQARALSTCVL